LLDSLLQEKNILKKKHNIMASALASLTANYTDSEGEDERHVETESGGLHPSLAERLGKLGKRYW